jgi:hypothetical protein
MSISPWEWSVEAPSPDGKLTAIIEDAAEIAMGAPTSGTLRLSNGFTVEECNPSLVWSSDSQFLAVPQWTRDKAQRLLIIEVANKKKTVMPGSYRVLQLESFENGVISGIDSPIHMPTQLRVPVAI